MPFEFDTLIIFRIASIVIGVVVSLVLWNFPRKENINNRILSIALLCLSYALAMTILADSKLFLKVPHLYRTGNFFALIYVPLSYVYLSRTLDNKPLRPIQLLHFIPAFIFLIDFSSFYILSAEEKLIILQNDFTNTANNEHPTKQGWLMPHNFHATVRTIVFTGYWILQVRLLLKFYRTDPRAKQRSFSSWRKWYITFIALQSLIFVPYFAGFVLPISTHPLGSIQFNGGLALIATALYLLFKPEILYGLSVNRRAQSNGNEKVTEKLGNGNEAALSEKSNSEMAVLIKMLMDEKHVYLQHKYSLQDLSNDLKIPPHALSSYINKELGLSFNDCLNRYRIEHCLQRIKKGDVTNLTIEGIGFECGFNNRNSFTSAFKKWTGQTPSQYLRLPKDEAEINTSNS